MVEAGEKTPSSEKENAVKDDAFATLSPVYKQLSSFFLSCHLISFFFLFQKDFSKVMQKNMQSRIYYTILQMAFEKNPLA